MKRLLDERVQEQVREAFQPLKKEVMILFFGSQDPNCVYCTDTKELLEEVTALSDKLHLQVFDIEKDGETAKTYGLDKAPAFVIAGYEDGKIVDYGIRFLGIPGGHEFTTLIRGLLMISLRDSGLQTETRDFLADLDKDVLLQVFITPTCPYCPQAVILAHQMALESSRVAAEMIEAMEFPELAKKYGVSGVPHTVINSGASEQVGAVPEHYLVEKIREALAE